MGIALAKQKSDEAISMEAAERAKEARSFKSLCLGLEAEAVEDAAGWSGDAEVCCDCGQTGPRCTCPRYEGHGRGEGFPVGRYEAPAFSPTSHRRGSSHFGVAPQAAADGTWELWMGSMQAQWSHTRAPVTFAEGFCCQKGATGLGVRLD